ncbi:MAG: hypothetical protein H6961_11515 [Chromatiaceae bacterium]|nr:hypothetical protein [Chromatiaceae bacterium]
MKTNFSSSKRHVSRNKRLQTILALMKLRPVTKLSAPTLPAAMITQHQVPAQTPKAATT